MAKRARRGDETKVVGYIRRSTNKQALTPEAQQAALEKWCAERGAQLVSVVSDTCSGATKLHERQGFIAALGAIKEHGAGVLLVAKRDRLARGMLLMLTAEAEITKRGARLASVAGEGSDDLDPILRQLTDMIAERERRIIGERTRFVLRSKRARGEKTGGNAPYGFVTASKTVGDREVKYLLPEPNETAVIERVKAMRAAGISYPKIAEALTADGIAPRSGAWGITKLRRLTGDDLGRKVA